MNGISKIQGALAGARILRGKISMVTGAGAGIGEACVRLFAGQGSKVIAVDMDGDRLERVCSDVNECDGKTIAVRADVTDSADLNRAFRKAAKAFGPLDVLVNNAGGGLSTDFFAISEDEWNRVVNLNLTSVFMASQRAAVIFKDRGSGCIINMSSLAGRSISVTAGAHYTAGKAGMLGLTRHLARILAPYNVRVNAVCPGVVNSERLVKRMAEKGTTEEVARSVPLGRIGDVSEVASVCLFLASDLASYITGASLDVNGGAAML
ncbi:MAG: SDR family oxidoreductase [Deltaproteobacteria bacterium]|nr:SDR family oxidoreductase [Deltaproteobacteria bacterium]MBW2049014.1 SDR family oxidoreductase [Deltaproteobacteria bacterium]MBW2147826.1 SDR family oxidoreductase [Deltaproteobacteria bacterium]MBW2354582.1 SDR family oxidoreductase [Deltaproteobacteria bacterium]